MRNDECWLLKNVLLLLSLIQSAYAFVNVSVTMCVLCDDSHSIFTLRASVFIFSGVKSDFHTKDHDRHETLTMNV